MVLKDKNGCEVYPVVIGTSFNAYGLVRSFGEEDIKSFLVVTNRCFVQYSKYVKQVFVLPDINTDEELFLEKLIKLGESIKPSRGMIFPTHDEYVLSIAKNRRKLEKYFEIPWSDYTVCDVVTSKDKFNKFCQGIGIPTIKEFLVDNYMEAQKAVEELGLPIIIKPNSCKSDASMKTIVGKKNQIFYAHESLKCFLSEFYGKFPDEKLLIQEFIENSDKELISINTFSNKDGEMMCVIVMEKIRQYPKDSGTSLAMTVVNADDNSYVSAINNMKKILRGLTYYGLSGIEFKYDKKTRDYKIIEMNPRSEFFNYLQTMAGLNMAYQLYRLHLGKNITNGYFPKIKKAQAVVPINDFLYTIFNNREKGKTIIQAFKEREKTLVYPQTLYGITIKDIKPFVYVYVYNILRGIAGIIRLFLKIPNNVTTVNYFYNWIKFYKKVD